VFISFLKRESERTVRVAYPDFKSEFQTYSNPDLTKNWDPDFRFKSSLKLDNGFQISYNSGLKISNSVLIRISDFKSGLKTYFVFQFRFSTGFRISNSDLIRISDKHPVLVKSII
jgi:hypothetical protein